MYSSPSTLAVVVSSCVNNLRTTVAYAAFPERILYQAQGPSTGMISFESA